MTRGIKIFFIVFILSLPFWWGANDFQKKFEDFLFWEKMADNSQLLTAQLIQEEKLEKMKPIREWQIGDLDIGATSGISVFVNSNGSGKILFEKEIDKVLPIASLIKLMTADIVWEDYDPSLIVEITKLKDLGNFKIGEKFSVGALLYPLLMESSNDAAVALAQIIGEKSFVDLMNLEAKNLGMENTNFVNPTGLDPDNPGEPKNYSTVEDLVKLTIHLLKTKPKIMEILATPEIDFYTPEGVFHHKLKNTNQLLNEIDGIIGGKTGWTDEAQGCLLLVTIAPKNRGEIINVILGSENRFEEMKNLINWINSAYRW
jgi:D-alanyl-D-alanine carboxypeptidase